VRFQGEDECAVSTAVPARIITPTKELNAAEAQAPIFARPMKIVRARPVFIEATRVFIDPCAWTEGKRLDHRGTLW
jgi:hypothetical protein